MSGDKRRPWSKFYWADWTGDRKLRSCGLAARGLWMEMLAVMHEATPYGYLLMGGLPLTAQQLANQAGCSLAACERGIAELERASVFSRDEKGVIYSRRMVRDHAKSEQGRADIGKRWRDDRSPNSDPNRSPNRVHDRPPTDIPITPYARDQKEQLPSSELVAARAACDVTGGYSPKDLADVIYECLDTAGFDRANVMQYIEKFKTWFAAGCHPEDDVQAAINAMMAGRPYGWRPSTMQFFEKEIFRRRDMRLKAKEVA